jgi:hypothetical protein
MATINQITGTNISTYIASVAITDAYIGNLSAGKLTTGTLDAARIAANTIDASKINANGLSIKDTAGNVILAAGSSLSASTLNFPGTITNIPSTIDNSKVPYNQNLIPWSDQTLGVTMDMTGSGSGSTFDQGIQYASNAWDTTNYVLAGTTRNLYCHQNNIAAGGDTVIASDIHLLGSWDIPHSLPVIPGQTYVVSAYVMLHRCTAAIGMYFYNGSGTLISSNEGTRTSMTAANANTLENYSRLSLAMVAPAGATNVRLYVRKYNTTAGNTESYLWIAAPQLEVVPTGMTTPSPYVSGPSPQQKITGSNATTFIADLAVNSLQIADNAATYCLSAQSAGNSTSLYLTLPRTATVLIIGTGQLPNPQTVDVYTNDNGAGWVALGNAPFAQGSVVQVKTVTLPAGTWGFATITGGSYWTTCSIFVSIK